MNSVLFLVYVPILATQLALHGPILSVKVSGADEIDLLEGNVVVDSVADLEVEEEEGVVVEDVGVVENQ